jgi:hypothetical protein
VTLQGSRQRPQRTGSGSIAALIYSIYDIWWGAAKERFFVKAAF